MMDDATWHINQPWTDAENEQLVAGSVKGLSDTSIANEVGRSKRAVACQRQRLWNSGQWDRIQAQAAKATLTLTVMKNRGMTPEETRRAEDPVSDEELRIAACVRHGETTAKIAKMLRFTEDNARARISHMMATGIMDKCMRKLENHPPPDFETLYQCHPLGDGIDWEEEARSVREEQRMQDKLDRCAQAMQGSSLAAYRDFPSAQIKINNPCSGLVPRGKEMIPQHCVDAMVLQLTNTASFYKELFFEDRRSQFTCWQHMGPASLHDHAVRTIMDWIKLQWPSGCYMDGSEETFTITPRWRQAVIRGVLSQYRDQIPYNDDPLMRCILEWLDLKTLPLLVEGVRYTWRERKLRVPLAWVMEQIVSAFSYGYGNVPVYQNYAGTRTVPLTDEDLRRLAPEVRVKTEAYCNLRIPEDTGVADYVGQETYEVIPSLTDIEHETIMSIGDEAMKVDYVKDEVTATGTKNLELHKQKLNDLRVLAETQVRQYVADVVQAVVKGESLKAQKPLEITLGVDNTKDYADKLNLIKHVSGEVLPSSEEVLFLLADVADNSPVVVKRITLNVQ